MLLHLWSPGVREFPAEYSFESNIPTIKWSSSTHDEPHTRTQSFGDSITKRIVIKMKKENLDSQDYRSSATKIFSEVFPERESDPRILFLGIDVCSGRFHYSRQTITITI